MVNWKKKKDEDKVVEQGSTDIKVEKTKETTKSTPAKKTAITKSKKAVSVQATKVFVKPFISEKAAVCEAMGMYTFVVANNATKIDIKNAVKEIYGVEPKKVRVMNMEGKKKRQGRRIGRRSDWKKAVVTLPKGQSISIHEGV